MRWEVCATRCGGRLNGRTEDKLQAAKNSLLAEHPTATVELFVGDTADEAAVSAALRNEQHSTPTKVVANAGIAALHHRGPRRDQYDEIMRINAKGTLLVFKHAARHMAQHGGALWQSLYRRAAHPHIWRLIV